MTPALERLKELSDELTALERIHAEALTIEPTIARPLHQAADEARRRLNQLVEPKTKQ